MTDTPSRSELGVRSAALRESAAFIEQNYSTILDAFRATDLTTTVHWHTAEQMAEYDADSASMAIAHPPNPMDPATDGQYQTRHVGVRQALKDDDPHTAFTRMHDMLDSVWAECQRVLRDGAILAVIVADTVRNNTQWPNASTITGNCMTHDFRPLPSIRWEHAEGTHKILLFRNEGQPSFDPSDPLYRASCVAPTDEWGTTTWELDPPGPDGELPTHVPHRLVQMYSALGDTVLVPFLGSGESAGVARELGRSAVGYEVRRTDLYGQVEQRLIEADSLGYSQILDWYVFQYR